MMVLEMSSLCRRNLLLLAWPQRRCSDMTWQPTPQNPCYNKLIWGSLAYTCVVPPHPNFASRVANQVACCAVTLHCIFSIHHACAGGEGGEEQTLLFRSGSRSSQDSGNYWTAQDVCHSELPGPQEEIQEALVWSEAKGETSLSQDWGAALTGS